MLIINNFYIFKLIKSIFLILHQHFKYNLLVYLRYIKPICYLVVFILQMLLLIVNLPSIR
jgi:hypothetical protein